MKILKAIGVTLFVAFLAFCMASFVALGMIGLALKDFFGFLGRRLSSRMRGERFGRNLNTPVIYYGNMVMDADGFVEPPESRENHAVYAPRRPVLVVDNGPVPKRKPKVGRGFNQPASTCRSLVVSPKRDLVPYVAPTARNLGSFSSGRSTTVIGCTILQFPVDEKMRERLRLAYIVQEQEKSGIRSNLVSLAQRRSPGNVVVLSHFRPVGKS